MSKLLLILTLLGSLASSQTTWKGLRFGMSEDEVRKTYEGPLQPSDQDGEYMGLGDTSQRLEGMPMSVHLVFSGVPKKLAWISLLVNKPFADQAGDLASVSRVKIKMLEQHLVEKYGKPIREGKECQSPYGASSCDMMWKADEQNVLFHWVFFDRCLQSLTLTYKPLPKEI